MALWCNLFGHRRVPQRAWHDGYDWRATCKRCGTELLRAGTGKGRWREFDGDADGEFSRTDKPGR